MKEFVNQAVSVYHRNRESLGHGWSVLRTVQSHVGPILRMGLIKGREG